MRSPSYSQDFFRYFLLAILALALGALTLFVGLYAGRALTERFFAPQAASADATTVNDAEPGDVSFSRDPIVVPIDYTQDDFTEAVALVRPAVVSITLSTEMNRPDGEPGFATGSGSGFIFYVDDYFAYIATNSHVVEGAHTISVSLDDETHLSAREIGACVENDLAVLAVTMEALRNSGKPFAVAEFGDSDMLRMGDSVVAIGNALGGGTRTTQGIVSALSLNIRVPNPIAGVNLDLYVLQTDAAVNRGNSGGPLINQHGQVIGIITAKFMGDGVEGMGYALPINHIRNLLETLRAEGSVVMPFIGISHYAITESIRQMFNLPASHGLWITAVHPNTPAYEAGLQRNDIILSFAQVEITSFDVFRNALLAHRPGDTVTLGVLRDEARIYIDITLGAPPQ
ncbi:MAG: trypsin-like peptidase domain-containing protein [Defluviitaleaceae bacterium]|nr:trypsin-like peptidase domain-containing protein [Defluviitaleaceae bacterium]